MGHQKAFERKYDLMDTPSNTDKIDTFQLAIKDSMDMSVLMHKTSQTL